MKERFLISITLLSVTVIAMLALPALAAAAGCPAASDASFSIDQNSGPPGTEVTASGTGVGASIPYDIYWDSTSGTVLASGVPSTSSFATMLTIPADATVSDHLIIFSGYDDMQEPVECEQPFTVTQPTVEENAYTGVSTVTPATPQTTLPSTGAMLLPAAGLLVAGAALVARRRRQ